MRPFSFSSRLLIDFGVTRAVGRDLNAEKLPDKGRRHQEQVKRLQNGMIKVFDVHGES